MARAQQPARPGCQLLRKLEARGDFSLEGEPLACLLVEARGDTLLISGRTPFQHNGTTITRPEEEFLYILEQADAEAFLQVMARSDPVRPERAIAEVCEFSGPDQSLASFLDDLGLNYQYHVIRGDSFL